MVEKDRSEEEAGGYAQRAIDEARERRDADEAARQQWTGQVIEVTFTLEANPRYCPTTEVAIETALSFGRTGLNVVYLDGVGEQVFKILDAQATRQ